MVLGSRNSRNYLNMVLMIIMMIVISWLSKNPIKIVYTWEMLETKYS